MTRIVLSYTDLAALPNDGRRYELHEGELSMAAAPSPVHQEVLLNLAMLLSAYVKRRGLGKIFVAPLDCLFTETTVLQPDILFVDSPQLARIGDRGLEGVPALVVEIVSPSTVDLDHRTKLQLYAKYL